VNVVVRVPSGATASLERDQVARLVDALWAVSATTGAVALVGKLRHALTDRDDVAVADDETRALLVALTTAADLPAPLAGLRDALSQG
jgi:hypothetical protein